MQFEKIVENNRKFLIKEICDIQNNTLTEEIKNNGLKLTEQIETLNQLQKEVEMRVKDYFSITFIFVLYLIKYFFFLERNSKINLFENNKTRKYGTFYMLVKFSLSFYGYYFKSKSKVKDKVLR